jgi:hypothetical protein
VDQVSAVGGEGGPPHDDVVLRRQDVENFAARAQDGNHALLDAVAADGD